jgi:NADPH:quinone reductase-like Zn-dependent oxidoreductase
MTALIEMTALRAHRRGGPPRVSRISRRVMPGDEVYRLIRFDRDGAAAEFVAVPAAPGEGSASVTGWQADEVR